MVEYGLLVALISIVALAAVGTVGAETSETFDSVAVGLGSEQAGGSQDDDQNGGNQDDDQNGNDQDDDQNGGNQGGGGGEPIDEDEEPEPDGSTVAGTEPAGSFYWWNSSRHGGEGAWKASVSYQNDWIRHQYLTLEVTKTDEEGNTETVVMNNFYVPANGSASFANWDNELKLHKGKVSGVVSVQVKVTKIRTSDEDWQTVSYDTDGPTTTVDAPATP